MQNKLFNFSSGRQDVLVHTNVRRAIIKLMDCAIVEGHRDREGDEEEGETSLQSSPKAAVQHSLSGREETSEALALAAKPKQTSHTSV